MFRSELSEEGVGSDPTEGGGDGVQPMRVMLVGDQTLFLEGLQILLAARGIEVLGAAGDGRDVLEMARALRPNVILMDDQLLLSDGPETVRAIKAELPETKIIMLAVSADDGDLFEAIRSGAQGYLLKSADAEHFFRMLSSLAEGEPPRFRDLTAGTTGALARKVSPDVPAIEHETVVVGPLSRRQVDVLARVAQGLTYKEIGAELCLTERAVKYHMGQIVERLRVRNRVQAVAYAPRAGPIKHRPGEPPSAGY